MEKLRYKLLNIVINACFLIWINSCSDDAPAAVAASSSKTAMRTLPHQTENVVVVVIDGPRYSETWGHPERKYIPLLATELAPQGTFFNNFKNEGLTRTLAGHTAIVTGNYQYMANDGSEIPQKPSIFQHFLSQTKQAPDKACIVTSKYKLNVLGDCRNINWRGKFNPSINCGANEKNRSDKETLAASIQTLEEKEPKLMLVQFLGPDKNGHENNWNGYLESLQETDSLVFELWSYIQQDEHYRNKTALLITNDHGRHADNHKDGFVSHGDDCNSCRHISLLALGPDFEAGAVIEDSYDQIDLAPTIAELLQFKVPAYGGSKILPLLENGN